MGCRPEIACARVWVGTDPGGKQIGGVRAPITTTEFLCRYIHEALQAAIRQGDLGDGADSLTAIRVSMGETLQARAWYEAPIAT